MWKYNIIQFLNDHPELTENGIESNREDPRYKEQRVNLYQSLDEIEKCNDWLDRFYVPSKRKKDETSSYALKHYVESYFKKYIPNGAFVTAYMMKYYDYKTEEDNPNLFVKVQPKLLERQRFLYHN
jgi:hypothetical protein